MEIAINQNKKKSDFIKLLFASFISQCGSYLLTLYLATFVFISSGSPVKSSLVFIFAFLPSVLVSSQLGSWIDRSISRSFLIYIELLSIFTSALCGTIVAYKLPLFILCSALGIRSILTFTSRTAATKWLKCITPLKLQSSRMKLLLLSFFLSTVIAGILAAIILQLSSINWVVLLDILTYSIGILFLLSLQKIPISLRENFLNLSSIDSSLTKTIKKILQTPEIKTSFLFVCLSQAIFQGAYSSLISVLPILGFNLSPNGVGMFQVVTSIGIILGFLVNWHYPSLLEQKTKIPSRTITIFMVATVCLFLSTHTNSLPLSLLSFFGLNFAYEFIWLFNNTEFFRASPTNDVARYQFTLTACASLLMSIFTLIYAFAIETLGLPNGSVVFLIISIMLMIIVFVYISQNLTFNRQQS